MENKSEIQIGIITLYYNNLNYGGSLQAYALCKIIKSKGYQVEQISYDRIKKNDKLEIKRRLKFLNINSVLNKVSLNAKKIVFYRSNKKIALELKDRKELFYYFLSNQIDHSKVYTPKNINQAVNSYDIFICGSDQIWNQNGKDPAYFLDFVPQKTPKISYAASIGKKTLKKKQIDYMVPKIKRLDYISVREKEAKDILKKNINQKIKVVVDPTLLLTQNDWNKIALSTTVKSPYIFVYLLGNNKKQRKTIKEIGKFLNLKIAFIPYVHLNYEPADENFADIDLYDVGPAEFVGLIKNAAMVITDSFHGCVFSIIYHKKFWALKRHKDTEKENMNSRLYTLFGNLGLEERLLDDDQQLTKDELLKEIDYEAVDAKLDVLRKDSMDFLEHALSESVKMIEKNKNI
ncbi:polysaccharide pyruvyl transferase [Eubacterium limosum]|nr:polysaccharide pyruvyl transferase [Eubacterium limosum]